jgi:hypothetical protein
VRTAGEELKLFFRNGRRCQILSPKVQEARAIALSLLFTLLIKEEVL